MCDNPHFSEVEDYYYVNKSGEIYSFYSMRNGEYSPMAYLLDKDGYQKVSFIMKGDLPRMCTSVHRVVAFMFVENPQPDKFNTVNHIDEDKVNNNHTNLEWCDVAYNINYGNRTKNASKSTAKPVECYTLGNTLVKTYEKMSDVENDGFSPSKVSLVVNGMRKTHGGYKWKIKE